VADASCDANGRAPADVAASAVTAAHTKMTLAPTPT